MSRLLTALLITLAAAGLFAAPSIPDVLPAETFAVLGTPDATALREGFERSPGWALWQEQSYFLLWDKGLVEVGV